MQDTQKTRNPTPEQETWDAKERLYTRNSYIALGVWMVLNVGSFAWVIINKIVPYFAASYSVSSSGQDRSEAFDTALSGWGLLVLIIMVSALLVVPLKRAVRNAFWSLGSRPSDDYKPRIPKPIDVEWEQVSDEIRIARVGDYQFRVQRYNAARSRIRRTSPYGYRVTSNAVPNTTVIYGPSIFKGMTDDGARQYLEGRISLLLERSTGYFASK